jgi:hypothetical protein
MKKEANAAWNKETKEGMKESIEDIPKGRWKNNKLWMSELQSMSEKREGRRKRNKIKIFNF